MEYPEQDRPIYLWDLNSDGTIKKFTVTQYRTSSYTRDKYYFLKLKSGRTVRENQMDRFLNNRVASFNGDDARAIKIIDEALSAKERNLKEEHDRVANLLGLLRSNSNAIG